MKENYLGLATEGFKNDMEEKVKRFFELMRKRDEDR
jgi:hypothetical protein